MTIERKVTIQVEDQQLEVVSAEDLEELVLELKEEGLQFTLSYVSSFNVSVQSALNYLAFSSQLSSDQPEKTAPAKVNYPHEAGATVRVDRRKKPRHPGSGRQKAQAKFKESSSTETHRRYSRVARNRLSY